MIAIWMKMMAGTMWMMMFIMTLMTIMMVMMEIREERTEHDLPMDELFKCTDEKYAFQKI